MENFEIKNSEKITSRCPQYGRSMIEMLGVLAIIGVLSVGGIAGYSKAMMKYKINKTIEQITLIAGNVRTFFGRQQNYNGFIFAEHSPNLSIPTLKAKLIPDDMIILGSNGKFKNAVHEFGNSVWGNATNKSTSGDEKAFLLQFFYLPPEACIELATHDWTNAGVKAIQFQSTEQKDPNEPRAGNNYYNKYLLTPIDVDEAITRCSLGDPSVNHSITFYFDIDTTSTYWQNIINPSS